MEQLQPQHTLRRLIQRRALALGVLPLVVTVVVYLVLEGLRLERQAQQELEQQTNVVAAGLINLLDAHLLVIQATAAYLGERECFVEDCAAEHLRVLLRGRPNLGAVALLDASGGLRFIATQGGDVALDRRAMSAIVAAGRDAYSAHETPTVSGVRRLGEDMLADAPARIDLIAPILDPDGGRLGVLIGSFDVERLRVLTANYVKISGRPALLLLLDHDERVIAASGELGLQPAQAPPAELRSRLRSSSGSAWSDGGRDYRAHGLTLPRFGWHLVLLRERDAWWLSSGPFIAAVALAFLCALGLIWLGSVAASRSIAKPLESLSEQLDRLDPATPEVTLRFDPDPGWLELERVRGAIATLQERVLEFRAAQEEALQARNEANARLEAEIAERDRYIEAQTAQLRAALSKAQDAAQMKDQLLTNTSHEMRTPLNGIIGMAELLLRDPLGPEQRRSLETILTCAEGLLELINDLLDLSRLRGQGLQLVAERFDLPAEVQAVYEALKPLAERRGLQLSLLIEPSLHPKWIGDSFRVRQVLMNLVSNAIKFTQRGFVQIDLRSDAEHGGVQLSVQDTGVGIPEDQIERIFEPFVQLDQRTNRWHQGTGLGLTITRQLIELMGGRLSVSSVPLQGSKFTVRLPLPRAPLEDPAGGLATVHEGEHLIGLKALVVDDVEVNRTLLATQLSTLGIESEGVADGFAALEALLRHHFDFVLLDCQMPGMDGYEVARRIRSTWPERSLPIIAVTAHALPSERQRCLDAGMDEYVAKPVRIKALRQVLQQVLGKPMNATLA